MKKLLLSLSILSVGFFANAQVAGSSFFSQIVSDWHTGFSFDTMSEAVTPADVHGYASDGDLSNYGATATLKFEAAKERHAFTFNLGYTYSYYDFSSDYFDFSNTNKTFLRMFYTAKISEKWGAFGVFSGSTAASDNACFTDGLQGLFGLGASYCFNENLRLGLGVAAYSRLDNTWLPLPVGFLEWQINKSLSLRVFQGAALVWDVFENGELILNASAEYKNSYLRIADYGNLKRSVSDSSYQFTIGATYNFGKHLYASASVGGNFWRKLKFRTNSSSAEDIDVDAAPVFYLHLGYKF